MVDLVRGYASTFERAIKNTTVKVDWGKVGRLVCTGVKWVIEKGAQLALAPLTVALAELGPAAPIVAKFILWVAENTAEGIRGLICDDDGPTEEQKDTIKDAADETATKSDWDFLSDFFGKEKPYKASPGTPAVGSKAPLAPVKPLAARILAASVTGRPMEHGEAMPISPLVTGAGTTPFAPQPIPHTHIGILTWPKMDDVALKRYLYWDRYQGTYNGQPNATFPKVGF